MQAKKYYWPRFLLFAAAFLSLGDNNGWGDIKTPFPRSSFCILLFGSRDLFSSYWGTMYLSAGFSLYNLYVSILFVVKVLRRKRSNLIFNLDSPFLNRKEVSSRKYTHSVQWRNERRRAARSRESKRVFLRGFSRGDFGGKEKKRSSQSEGNCTGKPSAIHLFL